MAAEVVHVRVHGDETRGQTPDDCQVLPVGPPREGEVELEDQLVDVVDSPQGQMRQAAPLAALHVHLHHQPRAVGAQLGQDRLQFVVLPAIHHCVLLSQADAVEGTPVLASTVILQCLSAVELVIEHLRVIFDQLAAEGVILLDSEVEENAGVIDKIFAEEIAAICSCAVPFELAVRVLPNHKFTENGVRQQERRRSNFFISPVGTCCRVALYFGEMVCCEWLVGVFASRSKIQSAASRLNSRAATRSWLWRASARKAIRRKTARKAKN